MAFCCSRLGSAIQKNDVKLFKQLINKISRVDLKDNMGYTSLHYAIRSSSEENSDILQILLEHPRVEMNCQNVEGKTALYMACNTRNADLWTIKQLLENNADVNLADTEDVSPLHIACKFNNLEIVKLLLQFGANINCRDFNKYTPLHYAIEVNSAQLTELLLSKNADANIGESHSLNALMFAIICNRDFTQLLLEHISDINAKSFDGKTAIYFAMRRNMLEVVKMLIVRGAIIRKYFILLAENYQVPDLDICEIIFKKIKIGKIVASRVCLPAFYYKTLLVNDFRYTHFMLKHCKKKLRPPQTFGLLSEIFNPICIPVRISEHFEENEEEYYTFFKELVRQGVKMQTNDIENFALYFDICPYQVKLFNIMQDTSNANITTDLVLFAADKNPQLGRELLQYCVHFGPNNCYDFFLRNRNLKSLSVFFKIFTPSPCRRSEIIEILNFTTEENILENLGKISNVKSLVELTRDAARTCIQNVCNDSRKCLRIVDKLEITKTAKDIIRCKIEVNIF